MEGAALEGVDRSPGVSRHQQCTRSSQKNAHDATQQCTVRSPLTPAVLPCSRGTNTGAAAGRQTIASTSGRRLTIPRDQIPLGLLVSRHDPAKVPASVISTRADVKRANRDAAWANRREQLLALAAAGVHVLIFAYNLAFWGQEGMPPDRWGPLTAATTAVSACCRHV